MRREAGQSAAHTGSQRTHWRRDITALKTSRLRSVLNFSTPKLATVVALDRRVSVCLDRQSIVTEKHPLWQYLPVEADRNPPKPQCNRESLLGPIGRETSH
ncbi:hypothetical protein EVAR_41700_1 [Eumeta japonica]|uniref:Uncharacterized protein n=1 Tax=Eumeta variegata TaxID=151549 RepID=A0A4C1VQ06_EUMVA|nr:hypothetical protein EVAR_41700_1 [Eumeta japonica]